LAGKDFPLKNQEKHGSAIQKLWSLFVFFFYVEERREEKHIWV
jgi:hypothetical protein